MRAIHIITLTLIISAATAQPSVDFTFNRTIVGYNYRLGLNYFFKNHFSTGLAVKYIEWINTDNQQFELKPLNFKEHLGLNYNFSYFFLKPDKVFKPFMFYDFSLTKATKVIDGIVLVGDFDSISGSWNVSYQKVYVEYEPAVALEHYIGLGFDIEIYKGLRLTERGGLGLAHYTKSDYPDPDFGWMANIGLKYDFGSIIERRKNKNQ